jgi:hypothetical protein
MSAASRTMLSECSDLTFECGSEPPIPASQFVCLASCSVVRDLLECIDVPIDPITRCRTIKLVGAPHSMLQIALDVLHEIQDVNTLDFDDVMACRRGMEFLGCVKFDTELAERVWVTSRTHTIQTHFTHIAVPILLEYPILRMATMNELIRRMPFWNEMREYLVEHVPIHRSLAKSILPFLLKMYPAYLAFEMLVESMDPASLSEECVLEMMGGMEIGIYFHPVEVCDTLDFLERIFRLHDWNLFVCNALRTLHIATRHYDAVPEMARRIQGSLVMYTEAPTGSVTLNISEILVKTVRIRVTPWLRIAIDPRNGTIGADISARQIDEMAAVAHHLQVRIMAFTKGSKDVGEVYYTWETMPDARTFPLETCDIVLGSHEKLATFIKNRFLKCIRIDLWYGDRSILEDPLRFNHP